MKAESLTLTLNSAGSGSNLGGSGTGISVAEELLTGVDAQGNPNQRWFVGDQSSNNPIHFSIVGNDVHITVNTFIYGASKGITINSKNYTQDEIKDLIKRGILAWEGQYKPFGENMNLYLTVVEREDTGISGQKALPIKVYNELGRSYVDASAVIVNNQPTTYTPNWVYLYAGQNITDTEQDFIDTVTHEMVHVFGSGDAYAEVSKNMLVLHPFSN